MVASFGENEAFGSRVLVGDKSQLVFWWLDLARKMYQTDNVGRTCLFCYSYHKLLRVPRRSFFVPRCSRPFLALLVVVSVCLCCWRNLLFHMVTSLLRGAHDPSYLLLYEYEHFY